MSDTDLFSDLKVCPWLKGRKHTPTLPDLAEYIERLNPENVFDVGCGGGELLLQLGKRGLKPWQLYGCDIEPDHVELTRRRTNMDASRLRVADFTKGSPFGRLFHVVTTMNWLQSDWSHELAVLTPHKDRNPDRFEQIIESVRRSLRPGGLYCWDWHGEDRGDRHKEKLESMGWKRFDTLTFPDDQPKRYPEHYPIYVHQRP